VGPETLKRDKKTFNTREMNGKWPGKRKKTYVGKEGQGEKAERYKRGIAALQTLMNQRGEVERERSGLKDGREIKKGDGGEFKKKRKDRPKKGIKI